VSQVQDDAVLRQRLAKHFHVSQAELVSYLRKHLQVVEFSRSGWATVYGVTETGRIYRSRDYFHRGGKAFGINGTPVLKYACGNPLVAELPEQPKVAAAPGIEVHRPQEFPVVAGLPLAPVIEVPTASPFAVPEEQIMAAAPAVAPVTVPTAVLSKALPLLPIVGLIGLSSEGESIPQVPEPDEWVLLAAGLAVVGCVGIWSRRREARFHPAGAVRRDPR